MIKYSLIVLLGINTMLGQSEDKIMHTVTCMGISAATYTYLRNKKQQIRWTINYYKKDLEVN